MPLGRPRLGIRRSRPWGFDEIEGRDLNPLSARRAGRKMTPDHRCRADGGDQPRPHPTADDPVATAVPDNFMTEATVTASAARSVHLLGRGGLGQRSGLARGPCPPSSIKDCTGGDKVLGRVMIQSAHPTRIPPKGQGRRSWP